MKESRGFDPGFFENLFCMESEHFWFRSRNKLIAWAIEKYFPYGKTFFEIGCGTGFVLNGIRKTTTLSLVASDVFFEALFFAEKRVKDALFLQMDACRIPYENEFDIIGAFDVLEHINDDIMALKEMHNALKREGGLILSVPQHPFLWSSFDEYSRHVRRYRASELEEKVTDVGFKVVRQISYVFLLLPLLMISRAKGSKNGTMNALRVGRRMNYILERVMDLERRLIRNGLSLPFGGSLLTICRKM
jgi:SAM-dependent methyltransferase